MKKCSNNEYRSNIKSTLFRKIQKKSSDDKMIGLNHINKGVEVWLMILF